MLRGVAAMAEPRSQEARLAGPEAGGGGAQSSGLGVSAVPATTRWRCYTGNSHELGEQWASPLDEVQPEMSEH